MTQQQQHQSAICSPESIQPILGWKQSAISEESRRCKWWVVSGDVKCLDYVNLISWYHDPEGQGFILEIIIEIRTWHVVVRCRLIVFILHISAEQSWVMCLPLPETSSCWLRLIDGSWSVIMNALCGRTENVSTSAVDSLMEAIINLDGGGFLKQWAPSQYRAEQQSYIVRNNDFQSKPG